MLSSWSLYIGFFFCLFIFEYILKFCFLIYFLIKKKYIFMNEIAFFAYFFFCYCKIQILNLRGCRVIVNMIFLYYFFLYFKFCHALYRVFFFFAYFTFGIGVSWSCHAVKNSFIFFTATLPNGSYCVIGDELFMFVFYFNLIF